MKPIPPEVIERVIAIRGTDGISDDAIESQVAALVSDPIEARRLIVWIPEAYGTVLVSHLGKPVLPKRFSATNAQGKSLRFPLTCEPIFLLALSIAEAAYRASPSALFQNIALRSSIATTANNALSAGVSIDGGVFSGPALIGIPAEIYADQAKPFWRSLFPW
jgi:hypothetical protein